MFSSSALNCFFVAVLMVLACSGAPAPDVPSISLPPEVKFWSIVRNDVPSPYISQIYPVQGNGFVYSDGRPMKMITADNYNFMNLNPVSPFSGNLQGFWRTWSYPASANQPVPQIVNQPVPQIVNQPVPQIVNQPVPQIVNQPVPQIVYQPLPQFVNPGIPQAAKPIPEALPIKYSEADEMNKNTRSRKKRSAFFPMGGPPMYGPPMYGGYGGYGNNYAYAQAGTGQSTGYYSGMGYPFMGR